MHEPGGLSELFDHAILRACGLLERWDSRAVRDGRNVLVAAAGMAPGQLIVGRYRLDALLGQGGMGRVWLATDTVGGHPVALKEMRLSGLAEGAADVDVAFKREFYTMTKLQHPGTVKVYDYGVLETADRFITMEVVKGHDLSQVLKRGPLDLRKLYRVLIDMANVLGFIHSRLFVHCDIKSENIRLTDGGGLKLMDFGLMHQLGMPAGGTLKGTLPYMAPEIPRGGVIDQRTDLYSLGVLAFELASGRYPFTGKTMMEVISQHLEKPPPKLRPLREVPDAFEAIVERLLAKNPKERFQDTAELIRALAALSGASIEVQDYGSRTSYLHCAELIGRSAEQQGLVQHLEAVKQGKGQSVFVTAPAGVGKTRLLQEFRLAVKMADISYVVGQCRAEGQAPLGSLVEALNQLLPLSPPESIIRHGPLLSRILPGVADYGVTPAPPADPMAEKVLVFEALSGWLTDIARQKPFIVCLEDLHWADAATIEYLNVVLRELRGTHAMVLGTFRSNEVDRLSALYTTVDEGHTARIELPPLSEASTAALVLATLSTSDVSEKLSDPLHRATGGNAFFITEALRAFIEQGILQMKGGRWELTTAPEQLTLPRTIEEVVTQRLGTLPAETLALCRRVAPLGRVLDLRVVKAVAGHDDPTLFKLLDEMVERQFVQRVEDQLYFAHDSVRHGVYQSTPEPERRAAHQRLGEALEALHGNEVAENAALLGYHFSRGDDQDKAVKYLLLGADNALKKQARLRATELFAQAADLIETTGAKATEQRLLEVWPRLVDVAMIAHPPTCVKYSEKLLSAWEKRVDFVETTRKFQAISRQLIESPGLFGNRKLARMWVERPLDPRVKDPVELVPKLFFYRMKVGLACSSMGLEDKKKRVLEELYCAAPDPGPFRASAFTIEGGWLQQTGAFRELRERSREALAWYRDHLARVGPLPVGCFWDMAYAHTLALSADAYTGQKMDPELHAAAMTLCDERKLGDVRYILTQLSVSEAAVAGDADKMEQVYGQLSDTIRRLGQPAMFESRLAMFGGIYWLQRADRERGEALCARMDGLSKRMPADNWLRRYALSYRGLLAAEWSSREQALDQLQIALGAMEEVPHFRLRVQVLCAKARTLAQLGDRDLARQVAEDALRLAVGEAHGNPWDETVAKRTLSELVEGEAAVRFAMEALQVAERHAQPLHQALASLTLGKLLTVRDRARAAEALSKAEALFRAHRATEWLTRLEAVRLQAAGR